MPQPLLEGHQEYVEDDGLDALEELCERVEALEERLREFEAIIPKVKRDAVVVVLSLLTDSLRHVASGKMDIPDVSHVATGGTDVRWEAIKARLAPRLKEAVEILLLQGPMRRTELAAALKMKYSNCTKNVIGILVRQGVIVENVARELTLKQL